MNAIIYKIYVTHLIKLSVKNMVMFTDAIINNKGELYGNQINY